MSALHAHCTLESTPCPMGCPLSDDVVLSGRDRLNGLPGEFTVVRCRSCELMRTDPRPSASSMGFYYPEQYAPYRKAMTPGLRPSLALLGRAARRLIRFRTNEVPELPPGRMLELGCASGAYLQRMASLGWQVEGVEFSPHAARLAASLGYPVHAGSIESAPAPERPYQLVVGWMVLEHLHDPLLALRKLHRWVVPGGWLVLSVPDSSAWEFSCFGSAWYALHLPNHLYHFTPASVENLLNKGGWRVTRVQHQRFLGNVFASLGFFLEDRGLGGRLSGKLTAVPTAGILVHMLLYPLALVLAALGQTGRMTIWARRDD